MPDAGKTARRTGRKIAEHSFLVKVVAGRGYINEQRIDVVMLNQARDLGRRPVRKESAHACAWDNRN